MAAKIVNQTIFASHPLDQVLEHMDFSLYTQRDRNFIHHLSTGTVRWTHRLLPILDQLLYKPLDKKHHDVLAILLIGLYQLIYLETPEYAALFETVQTLKLIKKNWATGLANKILRLFCKNKKAILDIVDAIPHQHYAHPLWLYDLIRQDWPLEWENILIANNQVAPMTLRVNPQFNTTSDYLSLLQKNNIEGFLLPPLPFAIQLDHAVPIHQLPGFEDGWVYIQDAAGQIIPILLKLEPGLSVLDACAAPGSKTTDILLHEPHLKYMIAIDKDATRLKQVQQNIDRLQINTQVNLIHADACDIERWWTGELFDRILIDAPCSGTGIIRRHPDIKILRRPEDIIKQVQQQYTLLSKLWPLLKNNGLLLYTTCSILKEENQKNIEKFLTQNKNATLQYEEQLLPHLNSQAQNQNDGFYYALLKKTKVEA